MKREKCPKDKKGAAPPRCSNIYLRKDLEIYICNLNTLRLLCFFETPWAGAPPFCLTSSATSPVETGESTSPGRARGRIRMTKNRFFISRASCFLAPSAGAPPFCLTSSATSPASTGESAFASRARGSAQDDMLVIAGLTIINLSCHSDPACLTDLGRI